MDPQACYQRILDARRTLDEDELNKAMTDLYDWLLNGGFPPTVLFSGPIRSEKYIIHASDEGMGLGYEFARMDARWNIVRRIQLPVADKIEVNRELFDQYASEAARRGIALNNGSVFGISSVAKLRWLALRDPILNNVPLRHFDAVTLAYNIGRMNKMTMAVGSCVYKHLLIHQVLKLAPVYV